MKSLAVKKGKVEQSLSVSEEQCSLACAGSDCIATTFDSKSDECTLYSSVDSLESGKLVVSPQVCPAGSINRSKHFCLTSTMGNYYK